ncbi:MAG: DUF167 domain-containing protein [Gemmatimonadales bacterium]
MIVHLIPRARQTAVAGLHGDAIKIRVAARPVDGAANAELLRFLAARLGLPRSAVTIVSGAARRRKTVDVRGLTAAATRRALLAEGA